jgi:hypothetical protein
MKFKLILLTFLLFSTTLFATHDGYIETYIPIANPQSELLEKEGIQLRKVLFFTYASTEEASINSVTWSYKANTPHKRYKNREANLAHIKGLKVNFLYHNNGGCKVTIDSRKVISPYRGKTLNKILNYVEKATRLNMKASGLHCKVKVIKVPQQTTKFSPKALNLAFANLKAFNHYKSGFKQAPFADDRFYPLGYSSDNKKFAYIIEHDTDPADIVHIETFIQDLVTDKIVWKNSYRVENYRKRPNFATFWKVRHHKIEKYLNTYGIKPSTITLQTGRHSYRHDSFNLSSKMATSYSRDWASNFLNTSTIYINSKKRGRKTINEKFYKHGSSHTLARKPMAFLASSNKSRRVAILVGTVTRGWEGPPHNLTYEIVGANLAVGFKK